MSLSRARCIFWLRVLNASTTSRRVRVSRDTSTAIAALPPNIVCIGVAPPMRFQYQVNGRDPLKAVFGLSAVIEERPRSNSFLLPITARIANVGRNIKPKVATLPHRLQVAFITTFRLALAEMSDSQDNLAICNWVVSAVHCLTAIIGNLRL